MQNTKEIKTLCKTMDKDLERTKDAIIAHLKGDPGHDIGDAGYALEILTNIITEHTPQEIPNYVQALESATKYVTEYILRVLHAIASLPQNEWDTLFNELYPGEYAYSGFGSNKP